MKTVTNFALVAVAAIIGSSCLADGVRKAPPPTEISFHPDEVCSDSTSIHKTFLVLILRKGCLTWDSKSIPQDGTVTYVDSLIKATGISQIVVYPEEGARFSEVVHAMASLRATTAKRIILSMTDAPCENPNPSNKSVEVTPTAVTSAADAPGAPSAGAPHH